MSSTINDDRRPVGRDELDRIVREHRLWLESDHAEGGCAALNRADLTSADLAGADLSRGDLFRSSASSSDVDGAHFRSAILARTVIVGVDLGAARGHAGSLALQQARHQPWHTASGRPWWRCGLLR